jgi:hypothetical protein
LRASAPWSRVELSRDPRRHHPRVPKKVRTLTGASARRSAISRNSARGRPTGAIAVEAPTRRRSPPTFTDPGAASTPIRCIPQTEEVGEEGDRPTESNERARTSVMECEERSVVVVDQAMSTDRCAAYPESIARVAVVPVDH